MMYYVYLFILILYIDNYVISNININIFNLIYFIYYLIYFYEIYKKEKRINILF